MSAPAPEKPLLSFCIYSSYVVTWPIWAFGFVLVLMNTIMPNTVTAGTAGTIWMITVLFCLYAAGEDVGREAAAYAILITVIVALFLLYVGSEYGWKVWPWLWTQLKSMQLEVPYKTIHIASWVSLITWLISLGNSRINNRWDLYNKQLVRIVWGRRQEPFPLADTNLRFGVDDYMDSLLTAGGGHIHFVAGNEHVSGIITDYSAREATLLAAQRTAEMSGHA